MPPSLILPSVHYFASPCHFAKKEDLLFFLDLKRAEVAMASGRLDEAFQILHRSSEREHRDGQRLTDQLISALVDRATQHLTDNRLDDARHDADKARQFGGRKSDITDLLQRISAADAARRHRQQRRDDVLASAKQQIQVGAYSVGARLLEGLKEDQSATGAATTERLAESIETRRSIVEDALARIQTAIDGGKYDSAVSVISNLQADQRVHSKIVTLAKQAVLPLVEQGFSEIAAGRLDRAAVIDDMLRPLQTASPGVGELQRCLTLCQAARVALEAHRYAEAESQLARLNQMIDGGTWINEARTAIADAMRQLNLVSAGPLGLLSDQPSTTGTHPESASPFFQPSAGGQAGPGRCLPDRSVLQVDGLGGLLMLTSDLVSIGAASSPSSGEFDVSLLTEGATASISIRRSGDDYFAESAARFGVNGQQLTRKLLKSGDSIAVGTRGRLRFLKPVAASGSAVLQMTGSGLARRDIRSVVLMADSLLFGPQGSHFRISGLEIPIVLHCDHNGYSLREATSRRSVLQQGVRITPATLTVGESVLMKDVRFALVDA